MKYKSEFKHGFTNRGSLHCAILKPLHGFKEKSPKVKGYAIFHKHHTHNVFILSLLLGIIMV